MGFFAVHPAQRKRFIYVLALTWAVLCFVVAVYMGMQSGFKEGVVPFVSGIFTLGFAYLNRPR